MTFEDFFIKKKIDLQQLQRAEPLLFEEFKSHYELMGEKSFDHTKKYWFNRLRKSFHLAEVIASVAQPAVTTVSSQQKNDSLSAETTSPAVKPMGFKPRFKAVKPQPTSESTTENIPKAGAETPVQKPIGFKPRFKPGQVGKAPDETKDNTTPVDQPVAKEERAPSDSQKVEASPTNKPTGFKPRFKAGVTTKSAKPVTEKTPVSDSQNTAEPTVKKEAASQISEQTKQAKAEPANEDRSGENTPPVSKPTGFKPRFKAGVTGKPAEPAAEKAPISDSQNTAEPTAKKEAASQISEQTKQAKAEPANEDRSGENTPPVSKPTGFKPRFKPKSKSNESDKDT